MEKKNNDTKSHSKKKNIAVAIIILAVALVISGVYLTTRTHEVTVNQLYDDMIDRNYDGVIGEADLPFAWKSYRIGDNVVVKDIIREVSFDSSLNMTSIFLVDYTGKYYGIRSHVNIGIPGNVTDIYHIGDTITLKSTMIEIPPTGSIYFDVWTIDD